MRYLLILLLLFGLDATEAQAKGGIGDAPISVDAESLEVIQNENKAIFTGDVVAKQGNMVLKAAKMIINYEKQSNGAGKDVEQSSMGALNNIEVIGNVHMLTPTETADAERGLYDAVRKKIFLYGNVVLKREQNVLNGSALQYDMVTGSSILTGGVSQNGDGKAVKPQRVRGIFVPKAQ